MLSFEFDYWSPTSIGDGEQPELTNIMYTDGGSLSNIPVISLIQRNVTKIILFFMSSVPLQPLESWDVYADSYDNQITSDLAALFGVISDDQGNIEDSSYEYNNNQIFSINDYYYVVKQLQLAQANGKSIMTTVNLTTIDNYWWGISKDMNIEITFSYLGRLKQWENLLSDEMKELVIPSNNPEDLSNDISYGPFRSFPHYVTDFGLINYERANLLCNMLGWSVLENEELFRHMLS